MPMHFDEAEYAARLNGVIDNIVDAWAVLSAMENDDDAFHAQMEEFLFLVHSLAGSAGTYGFAKVSEICREMENAQRAVDTPSELAAIVEKQQAQLDALLSEKV